MTAIPNLLDNRANKQVNIGWRNAYREAGYAVAIHYGNQQKRLPVIKFQISIKAQHEKIPPGNWRPDDYPKYLAKVEGGCSAQSLAMLQAGTIKSFSGVHPAENRIALEIGIINLIAASLAEAKAILLKYEGLFSDDLNNFQSLHPLCDSSCIELIKRYVTFLCPITDEYEYAQKLADLFSAALNIVYDIGTWQKITALAEFLQGQTNAGVMPYESLLPLWKEENLPVKSVSKRFSRWNFIKRKKEIDNNRFSLLR